MTQLSRASYTEALTMLRFGVAVRRAGWAPGEYVRRHMVPQPVPETLPSEGETITRWTPDEADIAATDWEDA